MAFELNKRRVLGDRAGPFAFGRRAPRHRPPSLWNDDRAIRDELFGVERLEQHGRSLAAAQAITSRPGRREVLLRRLADDEASLVAAYQDVAQALERGESITPAAEWLVDNFHVVEEQIREIRRDLPSGYYSELPKLAVEPFVGLPRVFGLTWAFVAHSDSLFDPEVLRRYVRAYQEIQPLTIGELWAVAITLRVILVENLRRVAARIVLSRRARRKADELADRILGAGQHEPMPAREALAPFEGAELEDAFFVQLAQRLRDQDPSIGPALQWIDEQLAARGTSADSVVQGEHQRQVAASVTVRNIVTSMRLISDVDWTELVERMSLVDDLLGAGSRFAEMDFPTRNLYRSAIEELARGSGRTELEIARASLVMAAAPGRIDPESVDARLADPGYYLLAGGRAQFEDAIGFRPPLHARPGRIYRSLGIGGYVAAGVLVSALLLALPLALLARQGLSWPWLAALGLPGLAPAVDLAVALVNHAVTRGFRATLLPALALKDGVPTRLRTLVVVPTILTSPDGIREQIERLEIHHLASPPGELHYALLTDWTDAASEQVEGDDALLAAAREGIARLNLQYGPAPGGDRFLLLHRRRVWTASEDCWMGRERKRGKLEELNRLLRGAADTTFVDPPPLPEGVRFVITLDADTRLPRETVRRLIGKLAHPLNRPRLDDELGRVVEGYAVLQPRVTPSLPVEHEGSLFLRVFTSAAGIDPYAAAVSDVYQDLFAEGSYTGKGIYDVDAFDGALAGRVPESAVLSHDLFEGMFARAGLASDVEVVEDFPARYDAAALRHHRWARGDWQLLPWILGRGPGRPGRSARERVPVIGRWKMVDNLRRSLSPPATVLTLVVSWLAPENAAIIWTAFVLATMALPPLLPAAAEAMRRTSGVPLDSRLRALASDVALATVQFALMTVMLAHQAWLMADAIVRTLVRLYVTRKRLLEWTPAAQAAFGPSPGLARYYRRMAGAVVIGLAALGAAWLAGRGAWPIALGFAAAWAASPAVAFWASLSPRTAGRRPVQARDAEALRLIARRTWRFFEDFVTEGSHWLPPDNFQENPEPVVARRTSPTNIGLYLLSIGCARDFGWIGTLEAVDRLEATFGTLRQLQRYRGHLYNWYDTNDLRPLDPKYVSSVDSGNLAGHLITLAGACREWRTAARQAGLNGVCDAIGLARGEAESLAGEHAARAAALHKLAAELEVLAEDARVSSANGLERLASQSERLADAAQAIAIEAGEDAGQDLLFWIGAAQRSLQSLARDRDLAAMSGLGARLQAIEQAAHALALEMDFGFLLDPDRLLLSIGCHAADGVCDPSCYDLLASEARLASFIAIAKGDAPARHWFRLGRAVTPVAHGAALISWSGSMFEYLMPGLVMNPPSGTLLDQTKRLIVRRQIEYGRQQGTPWGVSESAFNARDLELTYQYSNFGVPGLGLKRGLADNMVVAPYATALAAMVEPEAAARNFERLATIGARGRYGFYEAVDFTRSRVPDGEAAAVIGAFMAHHQGMSVVALADALLDGRMRTRFHADPRVQATELLLQERVPRDVTKAPPSVAESNASARARAGEAGGGWRLGDPWSANPDTQLLSNGNYSVMLTAAGSGYSAWQGMAVTRWREDATCDDWGSYVFLRDALSGEIWSAGLQPIGSTPDDYRVVFNEDRTEFVRRDGNVSTCLEVLVSAEDNAEVRRVTISNSGVRTREIEVTSYAELVLAPLSADIAHPAFSKMFIETEHLPGIGALLAGRRRRSPEEPEIWAAHLAVVEGELVGKRGFETDRSRFIGRGRSVRAPAGVVNGRALSGATGPVLDPIFALRRRLRIAPGRSARIDFWTMVGSSRDEVLGLVDKHHDPGAFERAAALAWTQAQVQLRHLGIDRGQAGQFQRLASHVIYAAPTLRPPSDAIASGAGGQPSLWSLGISGDLPIMLVRIAEPQQLDVAREALSAVEYWRTKRLAVDLVILNERGASYVQDLQVELETMVRASQSRPNVGEERTPGHIFLLRADLIAPEARALLTAVARVTLSGELGRLGDQLAYAPETKAPPRPEPRRLQPVSELHIAHPPADIEFFNGLGGFAADGKEYVTIIGPGHSTPAPWINVIANPELGFQVSAEGGGYSWSVNSREHQLTPWSNDPVTDWPGQALFVRDEETGELWSPTAMPIRDPAGTYLARHGFGYSRFTHAARGLALELLEYVPVKDPVRISRLVIRNASSRTRKLSATCYAEWVLGPSRSASAAFVRTSVDEATGALLARNPWNPAFAERTAFLDMRDRQTSLTGDRREFIGRNGFLASPAALAVPGRLSGRVGAGLDPCGAMRTELELEPGASAEVVVFTGDAENETEARRLVDRYRAADLDAVLRDVRQGWEQTLGAVQVKTPDRSLDILLNGWLLYQTLACRLWARSGFYQASGAYGFRDQLQDVMALTPTRPEIAREQILRSAARQFPEGDAQHWWLAHTGQGVRTRISDDRLWLPYVAARYVAVTGDGTILDEAAPFIEGPQLKPEEVESFYQPEVSAESASLYEHCARAIDVSLTAGPHGLPLIGAGDWNDGMNRVGVGGRGESVWLGWFLAATLDLFGGHAEARGDEDRADRWRAHGKALKEALEAHAWDGEWYLRAWFDDGEPLGSSASEECRIDSIAQSWAVLSGAARPERASRAMEAVERELILPDEGLALLFTPPFDRSTRDPGYIKGYPPGLRENGGQYSHAAAWTIMAFAALGDGDKAAGLFSLINPINHARTRSDVHRYKVEPYVMAGDVYSTPPNVGRGGWSWYTGSAGWLHRAGIESILGLRLEGGDLVVDPCIPATWPRFQASIRRGAARYDILVTNPEGICGGVVGASLDGTPVRGRPPRIPLADDGRTHMIEVKLGPAPARAAAARA